jgi:pimeloyl-ACP methyl ester carboxylesterase
VIHRALSGLLVALLVSSAAAAPKDVFTRVRDGYADNNGVRIHYVTLGRGPLIVMLHGFPDFWYGWREQIAALSRHYRVVALDLRGYNLSDQPQGVEQYDMTLLVGDVEAVIRANGRESAIVVGHDWGGAIAWMFAAQRPDMTERLIVLQTPHPRCILRELRNNPAQQAASTYARGFQDNDVPPGTTAEGFAGLMPEEFRERYREAFARSDLGAMLNYYKRNYPRAPYADLTLPNVKAPVLVIHGLGDVFLLADRHNSTWNWVDAPVTLATVPGVGHFIMQDAPDTVNRLIKDWLGGKALRR